MAMTVLALSKTYTLTVALGASAAVLLALLCVAICFAVSLKKREDALLRSDVYFRVPRPKPVILSKEAIERAAKKEAKKQEKALQHAQGKPKRGKKSKKTKYVFVSDVSSASPDESKREITENPNEG